MKDNSNRIISPNLQDIDANIEIRPQLFNDFVGQKTICDNLKVFVAASKKDKNTLDHILIYGPPGLGKTTLAQIIANELGVNFRSTSGPVIAKAGDLAALLTNLQTNDVLFIDEIHRLNPAIEEILYPAMEDFQLDLMIGEGPAARSVKIDLPKFTLIGATTRAGLISTPLRDRFGILSNLSFYEISELKTIIIRAAGILNIGIDDDGANEIAKRSRGTPRIAGRLLRRVKDFAVIDDIKIINKDLADMALWRLAVDDMGLDELDRKLLKSMAENYNGGPVGLDTIAASLANEKDVIEEVVEPYLLQQGMIQRTPRGRMLTKKSWEFLDKQFSLKQIKNNDKVKKILQPNLFNHTK